MIVLASVAAALAGLGTVVSLAGWNAVRRLPYAAPLDDADCPGITILRPLHGDEPLLEAALLSACQQNYPRFQVVFGAQDPADPALAVADRLRAGLPDRDIAVVCDDTAIGANRKIANLCNMYAAAKHDIVVIADSDMHAGPDDLRAIAAALAKPGVGLVTTLYTGLPANRTFAAMLAATGINHGFLPGAALGRQLGRQDCFGATMALRRETLDAIGGLAGLLDELADDHVLGKRVLARGERIAIAAAVPATTIPETDLRALVRHELRWARTIRGAAPAGFAFGVAQYSLAWAMLALLCAGGAGWAWGLAFGAWAVRAAAAFGVDRELGRRHHMAPIRGLPLLLPLRDIISVGVWLAAFTGNRVEWRGRVMQTRTRSAGQLAEASARRG